MRGNRLRIDTLATQAHCFRLSRKIVERRGVTELRGFADASSASRRRRSRWEQEGAPGDGRGAPSVRRDQCGLGAPYAPDHKGLGPGARTFHATNRSSGRCKKRPQPFNWDALPPRSPDDTVPAGNASELPSGSLTDTTTRGVMLHNARPHRAIHHEMLRAMLAWRGRASATLCHPLSDNLLPRNGPAPCCGRAPVRSAGCLAASFLPAIR
jgi:hypothetical protein